MKALFWAVGILALAVALVLAARHDVGYVLFVLPPYRAELSFNLFAVLLLAGFAAAYAVVRVIGGTLALPARVREYRRARARARAQADLVEALRELLAGRYARAEKAAVRVLERSEHPVLCAAIAARAAHELRARDRRDAYLARAATLAPQDDAVRLVTEADLMLADRRPWDAVNALKSLERKHTAALRLELRAQQMAKNWEEVLSLAEQLERRGVLDAEQAQQLRRYAQIENLKRKALDGRALEEAWKRIPEAQKKDGKITAAAVRCYLALGGAQQARQIIEAALEQDWDSELAALYADCASTDAVRQIEKAEAWLQRHPGDAALLLALGRLCVHQGLWGKAQSYLEASLATEPTWSAHLALAQLHEKLGSAHEAGRHYRASLDLALAQLRQIGGGRRRTPV